ncbi:hypothetical protein B9Z65_429 [Elsinoe australis]|uniref:Uncharacterized protein n=1 Tax=Elsinoe australis TaxID=40998 RepID=A0A2P8A9Z7_9PEZI|nr:hypothetical protein B9Z65_429 [Elsinoe australis]
MAKSKEKAAVSTKKAIAPFLKPTKSQLSQEKITESDSGSGSGSDSDVSESEEETAQANGTGKAASKEKKGSSEAESSEESSEGSESEEDEETDKVALKEKSKAAKGWVDSTNGHDEDASSTVSSSSEEESDEDQGATDAPKTTPKKPTTTSSRPLEAPKFTPPPGYTKITTFDNGALLDPSDLTSKELWHITLPASVPITQLTSIPLSALQSATPVLTHAGIPYILYSAPGPTASSTGKALLLPSPTSKTFKIHPQPITKTLHLKPQISLPNLHPNQADPATGSQAAAVTTFQSIDKTRPQVRRLKMRCLPPGFGRGRPGTIGSESEGQSESDSDIEMADAPAPTAQKGFRRPAGASSASTPQANDKANDEKASKKRKRDAPAPSPSTATATTAPETTTPTKSQKGQKADKADISEKRKRKPENLMDKIAAEAAPLATETAVESVKANKRPQARTVGETLAAVSDSDSDNDEDEDHAGAGALVAKKERTKGAKGTEVGKAGRSEGKAKAGKTKAETKEEGQGGREVSEELGQEVQVEGKKQSKEEKEARRARKAERARIRAEKEARRRGREGKGK